MLQDSSKLWIPDAFFKNAHESDEMKSVLPDQYIRIYANGDVLYSARSVSIYIILCPIKELKQLIL